MTAPRPAMSTVRISFTPDPAYVRTVRTVAVAVARRVGVSDDLLDEVRLAVGEACTRAVGVHRREGHSDPIEVAMGIVVSADETADTDDTRRSRRKGRGNGSSSGPAHERFTVGVTDRGSAEAARKEQAGGAGEIVARATVPPTAEDTGRNLLDEELLTIGVGLALLGGLAADLAVDDGPGGTGTQVRMSWPVAGAGSHPARRGGSTLRGRARRRSA